MFVSQTAKEDPPIPSGDVPDYGPGLTRCSIIAPSKASKGTALRSSSSEGSKAFPPPHVCRYESQPQRDQPNGDWYEAQFVATCVRFIYSPYILSFLSLRDPVENIHEQTLRTTRL